jgi:hypothetical protein
VVAGELEEDEDGRDRSWLVPAAIAAMPTAA